MSDIWIKASTTGTTRWKKATKISIKRASATWAATKNIWIKTGTSAWLRVWPVSGVYSLTDPFITTTSSGSTPIYFDGAPIRIGTTYYGRNGTWEPNGFTISSYTYFWPYWASATVGEADQLGTLATGTFTDPSNALTISSAANATATDGKYISFRITANASTAAYNGTADSENTYGRSKVIRRTPLNTSATLTGTPSVGQTLTYASAWNTTEAYKINTSRSTMKWYKSTSNTDIYAGGSRTEITRASGSYTITLAATDNLDGHYVIAEESVYNTGSDYDIGLDLVTNGQNQITKVTANTVTDPYVFAFGNTLHVGTNGYVSLDSANSVDAISSTLGRVIGILPADLYQSTATSIWFWSDTTQFIIRWEGYVFGSPSNLRQYEIIFDNTKNYARVYVIAVTTGSGGTQAFVKNGVATASYSAGLVTGSWRDVYFDGQSTPASIFGPYVPKSKTVMKQVTGLTSGSQDIGYTSIVTSINQNVSVSAPTSLSATTNSSAQTQLAWSGGNATYYEFFYGASNTTLPSIVDFGADGTITSSPYNHAAPRGFDYYYFVRSVLGTTTTNTKSAWFPSAAPGIKGHRLLYPPPTPNTPTMSGVSKTNITVSWTSPNPNSTQDFATSFEVYTSTTNSAPADTTSGTGLTSPASYTYAASTSPSTQYFWVRGYTEGGYSSWSAVGSATPTALSPPGTVSSVAGTASSTSIAWTWSAPTSGGSPTGYEYAISTTTSEPATFTDLGSTTRAVTTSSLTEGTDYYLFVKAKNADGTSAAVRNSTAVTTTTIASYTITYDGNGSTGGSTAATTGSGTVTLRSNGFTRTNATFAGWATSAGGTVAYIGGDTYDLSANTTLYAKWTANTVTFTNPTVTFTGTSGSGATTQRSWSWTTGTVSGATAVGYQWSISSTSATSGFGAFTFTTARTLTVTASTARWLKVRKTATDGLGNTVVSDTNNGV